MTSHQLHHHHSCPPSPMPTSSRDPNDDPAKVTPIKRRRLLPLVDIRGGGMAGSSVELGGRSGALGGSLGPGRRNRPPLTDLDAKFVTKSGLCVSGDVGGDGRGGPRITHLAGSGGVVTTAAVIEDEPRFPRLDQCAHFHYEYVELPPLQISLVEEDLKPLSAGGSIGGEDAENRSLLVQVISLGRSWVLRRTYENFRFLDRQLHRCCYDRKFSRLPELPPEENLPGNDREAAVASLLNEYVARLSEVAGSLITCGPVLNWLELDNRGHRLIVTDDSDINTPAVAAAYVVKRYIAQASDEISFEVGDMISVIDMPPPEESIWWRGKRGFQVGFFPCECVQVIGDKVPQTIQPQTLTLPAARTQPSTAAASGSSGHHTLSSPTHQPTKPVLRKHGKLIAFFRSFILSRPSRRKLKQSGILRERVFGCDLGEHLLNSGHEIPMVLRCCSEFLENHGVVDGIYRLSGITSNIQKLRNAFDEDRIPDLYGDDSILQDIHCVSSVLKMYFRELPNPLLTYQLYEKFVAAVMQDEDIRLLYLRDVVQQLPPPHYRTLEYLVRHLSRIASYSGDTGMTAKNIAIVWAPNLLRSKDLDMGGVAALQDVGTQAVVTEYLVRYVDLIFNDKIPTFSHSTNGVEGTPKKCRPKSLAISTPTKLISIEEARTRALNTAIKPDQKYIEVGGGPQNLPPKYHTVIELPSRKGGSLKQKKSPSGWKSIFSKGRSMHKHPRKASTPSDIHLNISDSVVTEADVAPSSSKRLRPVKSVESLISTSASLHSNRNSQAIDSPEKRENISFEKHPSSPQDGRESRSSSLSSPLSSPRTHNRSVSHDSYFNMLEGRTNNVPSQVPVKEEGESDLDYSPPNSRICLDISELDLNFSTSEKDLKGFEVDTLKSTSNEEPDNMSNSTLDMENLSMCSDGARSKENISPRPEKKSLKDKFKHRFTSPTTQRRNESGLSDSSEDSHNNSLKRTSVTLKDKLVHALSPETNRRRPDSSIRSASPGSSPKVKHICTVDTDRKELELDVGRIPEGGSIETVTAEVHIQPSSTESEEASSRFSMDALIDPELLDKITHLRTSPSVSASEVSSASLAEATVSDNESFTLGSSNSGAAAEKDTGSDSASTIGPFSNLGTPVAPSFSIVPEKLDAQPQELSVTPVTPVQEDLTPMQEYPKPRPNSLLGLPTADLLSLGSSITSPETPQGDSTFLEIQYHPLSDTTEPSTPSESQFVQDLVTVGQPVPCPAAVEEPRQSSPLSVDLSSSDDPTEEGQLYENVDSSTLGKSTKNTDHQYQKLAPSPSSSTQSSQASLQTDNNTSRQALLEESEAKCDAYDSHLGSVYENVQYGAEYENVQYGSGYHRLEQDSDCKRDCKRDSKTERGDVCVKDMYEKSEELVMDGAYENIESLPKESQPVYENLEDDQNVPDLDDAYEDYSFTPQYENVEFGSLASGDQEKDCDNKTQAEIEGEVLYQQVKFFRKSIQEVNDMLQDGEQESSDGVGEIGSNMTELPIQVPQALESLSSQQILVQQPGDIVVNTELITQPSEDSECLDSPVTPSSVSVTTEVLVLPAFASPTESTTDDVTSPVSSDEASSPRPKSENLDAASFAAQTLQSLSPPSDNALVPPAATSTPNRTLPLQNVISPAPWPRTGVRHTAISAPVPRPRQLPKLNLSPPVSPTSSPSSVSISPDSPATPGSPSSSSVQTTPVDESYQPDFLSKAELDGNFANSDKTPVAELLESDIPVLEQNFTKPSKPSQSSQLPTFQRYKSSPEFKPPSKEPKNEDKALYKEVKNEDKALYKELKNEDKALYTELKNEGPSKELRHEFDLHDDDGTTHEVTNILSSINLTDPEKRERIEQYKKERRSYLREKYKSESFRGEKDEMILRLRQKATSPSRPDDDPENEDEITGTQSSNSSNTSPRRSISPTKQGPELELGNANPCYGGYDILGDHSESQAKREEESAFKRSSPTRRSLSDMGRVGELKSPTRTRFSSGGSGSFRRSSSSGSNSSSSGNRSAEQGGSSFRRSPDKEMLLQRSSSSESKSSPSRKTSSSSCDANVFQRSSSTRSSGRSIGKDDIDEDINVKERVAIWSKNKKPAVKEANSEDVKIKKEQKPKEMPKKNFGSPPVSPTKKSSIPRGISSGLPKVPTSPSHTTQSSSIPKVTPSSPVNKSSSVSKISQNQSASSSVSKVTPPNQSPVSKVPPNQSPVSKVSSNQSSVSKINQSNPSSISKVNQNQSANSSISKVTQPNQSSVSKVSLNQSSVSKINQSNPSSSISKVSQNQSASISKVTTHPKVPPIPITQTTSSSSKGNPPSPLKSSSILGSKLEDSDTGGNNASVRGNAGQQRRIRDMAAIFERESPTSAKPPVLRQSSREEKKERY